MSTRESWALLREGAARAQIPLRQGPRDPQSPDERERTLTCMREHRDAWVVVQRQCNYSAFSGYSYTPSDYSGIRCKTCDRYWRTNAKYVRTLPDAEYGEI
jgi:hypothetical protein